MLSPIVARPPLSLVAELEPSGPLLYIGDAEAARDPEILRAHDIKTIVNCAVNLDINYVETPAAGLAAGKMVVGHAVARTYKIGLIDGDGNPEAMILAGYLILDGALRQILPEKPSYPVRERGNVLVHCRGGRSRSVALVSLYLHRKLPATFPTLDMAIAHVRDKRQLHEEEWFETPKPMLIEAARKACRALDCLAQTYDPPAPA